MDRTVCHTPSGPVPLAVAYYAFLLLGAPRKCNITSVRDHAVTVWFLWLCNIGCVHRLSLCMSSIVLSSRWEISITMRGERMSSTSRVSHVVRFGLMLSKSFHRVADASMSRMLRQ
ncbi:hypothetical protein RRG08_049585 [Elysia crispata]|uniref:Uncharacterized protein n=1 Tax=Elysia crispata TaxID=231223 RepID=A0AAE1AUU7_9GAST|nr:hypothetical protein RRG08_049585 [Elysia crispata]